MPWLFFAEAAYRVHLGVGQLDAHQAVRQHHQRERPQRGRDSTTRRQGASGLVCAVIRSKDCPKQEGKEGKGNLMDTGLMARIGRSCLQHPWWVLALWIVAVAGGVLSAGPVFSGMADSDGPPSLESIQGEAVLTAGSNEGATIVAVVDNVDPNSDAVRTDVRAAARRLAKISGVKEVHTPFDQGAPPEQVAAMVAGDRQALLVQVVLTNLGDETEQAAVAAVAPELHAMAGALNTHGQRGARILVGGGPVINQEANDQAQTDLGQAELLSLPITLIVLVFVFGGIVAAAIPAFAAIVAVTGSMVGLLIFAQFTTLDQNAVTVVTLMGLGLSIDYGLLLVARYREELSAGFAPPEAVSRAWATAGRTVMFSALTVAAALTGLLVLGVTSLSVLGAAGIAISLVAMLVSLTLTAALLGLAKRRIRPSRHALRRVQKLPDSLGGEVERGFFARLTRVVQRAPLITAVLVGSALLAAGYPMLSTNVRLPDASGLPRSLESVQVIDLLRPTLRSSVEPGCDRGGAHGRADPGRVGATLGGCRWRQPGLPRQSGRHEFVHSRHGCSWQ